MKSNFILFVLYIISVSGWSQKPFYSLQDCYDLLEMNYPLAAQKGLLQQQLEVQKAVMKSQQLPSLELAAQATYQSDVTHVPVPNLGIEPLSKDQYRSTLTMKQLIYAGGRIGANLSLESVKAIAKEREIEVQLYQMKWEVNRLYFSILLAQEQRELLVVRGKQLEEKRIEVGSGVQNGMLILSSQQVLDAEIILLKQQLITVEQWEKTMYKSLSLLIGKELELGALLNRPSFTTPMVYKDRPEVNLFASRKETLVLQEEIIKKDLLPSVSAFATGGYGNPALNMLENSFQPFYVVGMQLQWNILDWNASKKKRESLQLSRELITTEEAVFNLTMQRALSEQSIELEKLKQLIEADLALVELRKEVVISAASQMQNGVITTLSLIHI